MLSVLRNPIKAIQEWSDARHNDPRDPQIIDIEYRQLLAAAEQRFKQIVQAPATKAERLANARGIVEGRCLEWRQEYAIAVNRALGGRLEALRGRDGGYRPIAPRLPDVMASGDPLTLLCGLAPEVVIGSFEEIIDADQTPEGLPFDERMAALDECRREIEAIEERHTELVRAAAALIPPVHLTMLPKVQARIDAEAARAGDERQREQARQTLENRVNGRRISESEYLRQGRG